MAEADEENNQQDIASDGGEHHNKTAWPQTPNGYILGEKIVTNPRYAIFCAFCIPLQERCSITQTHVGKHFDPLQFEKQVWLMSAWRHPNILPCYCSFQVGHFKWIVTKPLHRGSLLDILEFRRILERRSEITAALEPEDVAFVVREVLLALHHLHKHGWQHKGISARNILLDLDGGITLSGFEKIEKLPNPDTLKLSLVEELYWAAPELIKLKGKRYLNLKKFRREKLSADIWSLGILMLEMVTQWPPTHTNRNFEQVLYAISRSKLEFLNKIPFPHDTGVKPANLFRRMVQECLQKNPVKRPSTSELLRNGFLELSKGKENFRTTVSQYFPGWEPKIDMSQVHLLRLVQPPGFEMKYVKSEPSEGPSCSTNNGAFRKSFATLPLIRSKSLTNIHKKLEPETSQKAATKGSATVIKSTKSGQEFQDNFIERVIVPTKYKGDVSAVDYGILRPLPSNKARQKATEVTDDMLDTATRDYFARATEGIQVSHHAFIEDIKANIINGIRRSASASIASKTHYETPIINPVGSKSVDLVPDSIRKQSTPQLKRKTSLSLEMLETVVNVSQASDAAFFDQNLTASQQKIPILISQKHEEPATYEVCDITLTTTEELAGLGGNNSITHVEQIKVQVPQGSSVKSKVAKLADATRNILSSLLSPKDPSKKTQELLNKKRQERKSKDSKLDNLLAEEAETLSMQGETASQVSDLQNFTTPEPKPDLSSKSEAIKKPEPKPDLSSKSEAIKKPELKIDLSSKSEAIRKQSLTDNLLKIKTLSTKSEDLFKKSDSITAASKNQLAPNPSVSIANKSQMLSPTVTEKKSDSIANKSQMLSPSTAEVKPSGRINATPYYTVLDQPKSSGKIDIIESSKNILEQKLTKSSSKTNILKSASSMDRRMSVLKTKSSTEKNTSELFNTLPKRSSSEVMLRTIPDNFPAKLSLSDTKLARPEEKSSSSSMDRIASQLIANLSSPKLSKALMMGRKSKTPSIDQFKPVAATAKRSLSKPRVASFKNQSQPTLFDDELFDCSDLLNSSQHPLNIENNHNNTHASTMGMWGSITNAKQLSTTGQDLLKKITPSIGRVSSQNAASKAEQSPPAALHPSPAPIGSTTKDLLKKMTPSIGRVSSQNVQKAEQSLPPPTPAAPPPSPVPASSTTKELLKKMTPSIGRMSNQNIQKDQSLPPTPGPPSPSPIASTTKKLTFVDKYPNSFRKLSESLLNFKQNSPSSSARANATVHFVYKDTNEYGEVVGSCHFLFNSDKDSPMRVATHMVDENLISGVQSATLADVLLNLPERLGNRQTKIKFGIVVWPKEFLSADSQPVLSVVFSKRLNDKVLEEVWLCLCEGVEAKEETEEIAQLVRKHGFLEDIDIPVFSYNLSSLLLLPNSVTEKTKPFYLLSNSKQTAQMFKVKLTNSTQK